MLQIKLEIIEGFTGPIVLEATIPDDEPVDRGARLTARNEGLGSVAVRGRRLAPTGHARYLLERQHAERLRQAVSTVGPASVASPAASGHNGATYTLEINRGQNASRYSWSINPPPGWDALGGIVKLFADDIAGLRVLGEEPAPA